jgi:hypothetical protein
MIRLSACATYGQEDDPGPLHFVLYAQSDDDRELPSFCQRNNMQLLPVVWNGGSIAAVEVAIRELSKPQEQVLSLIGLMEQQGYEITWLQDLAPDLPGRGTIPNVYTTRERFLENLAVWDQSHMEHLHDV